ncbi:MAG: tetratricopeptide repeat protein [Pseudomonadota bacterium]|nr:tetratricopeptide repeat protein [Pseudomonadota bacterium]
MNRIILCRRILLRIALTTVLLVLASPAALARAPAVEAVREALQKPDAEAAVKLGERAIAALPRDADAWYYAGQAYGRMAIEVSMLRKASWASKTRDAFQKAVSLDPDHLGAREGLVQFYSMAPAIMGGGKDKATAEANAFATRNPAGGHYLRAMTLEGASAERELRTAVRLAPNESRYRGALVMLLDRSKRSTDALAAIEAGLARKPDDVRMLYMLGRHAALHGQRTDVGLAALDRLLAKPAGSLEDISVAGAHWRRGQLREKQGLTSEALVDYRRAVALAPRLADAKKDLARLAAQRK